MSNAIVKTVQGDTSPFTNILDYFRQISKTLQFKVLDYQPKGTGFQTTLCPLGWLGLSSVQAWSNEYEESLGI